MSGHTPGPWEASVEFANDYPLRKVRSISGHGCVLAHVNTAWNKRSEADAKLIAAAPELLEALRPLAEKFLYPDDIDGHEDEEASDDAIEEVWISRKAIRAARAALAKAGL